MYLEKNIYWQKIACAIFILPAKWHNPLAFSQYIAWICRPDLIPNLLGILPVMLTDIFAEFFYKYIGLVT